MSIIVYEAYNTHKRQEFFSKPIEHETIKCDNYVLLQDDPRLIDTIDTDEMEIGIRDI